MGKSGMQASGRLARVLRQAAGACRRKFFVGGLDAAPAVACLAAAALLTSCGGGGGAGSPHGVYALPGIDRLPLGEIRASNDQVAGMVGIIEPRSIEDSELHALSVSVVACNSFVTACENPGNPLAGSAPFTLYTPSALSSGFLDRIPASTKLVSASFSSRFGSMVEGYGDTLPFAIVQAAGNSEEERYFAQFGYAELGLLGLGIGIEAITNSYEAINADKILYVSGYSRNRSGRIVRHPSSTGCVGVEEACVYAPFVFQLPRSGRLAGYTVSGTSYSAPNVAMALASVLAFYPGTSGPDLVRLAKTCAERAPGLSGLGLANFECMTRLDDSGEWRLVSGSEFASLISPSALRSLAFPGQAEIAGAFATGREGSHIVRLAARQPGLFAATDFSAAAPLAHPEGGPGFYPIASVGEESGAVGSGYAADSGFFAAAAVGRGKGFFGLGPDFGYGGSSTVDVSAGHRNLYLRATRQWGKGTSPILDAAEGSAVGVSARGEREIAPGLSVSASVHADRFVGGEAATAFGPVVIGQSPWNRRAEIALRREVSSNAEYAVGGIFSRKGDRSKTQKFSVSVAYRF